MEVGKAYSHTQEGSKGKIRRERQQEKGPHAGFKLEDGSTCLLATGAITELEADVNCTIY